MLAACLPSAPYTLVCTAPSGREAETSLLAGDHAIVVNAPPVLIPILFPLASCVYVDIGPVGGHPNRQ